MTIRDRKQLKATADRRLQVAAYSPRKLILIHSGLLLGVTLLAALCNYIITWQLDTNSSGLAGIQLRSILETAAKALSVICTVASPFWSMGLLYTALRLSRGKSAWPGSLLEGFRRGGPVFRFLMLQVLIYGIITFAAMYASGLLYTILTPAGRAFAEGLMKLISSGVTDYNELIDQIPPQVIERVSTGYLPFFVVVLLVLIIPAAYRLRLAGYLVMEDNALTPWQAIRTSGKIMRCNCWQMVLLDLNYWWYYLIAAVLVIPSFVTESALERVPFIQLQDTSLLMLGCTFLSAALTLVFDCFTKPKIMTTYALAYDTLVEAYHNTHPQQEA